MQDNFVEFQIILEKFWYDFITYESILNFPCDGSCTVTVSSMIY